MFVAELLIHILMLTFEQFLKLKEDTGLTLSTQGNADLCTQHKKCQSSDLPKSKFVASMKKKMSKSVNIKEAHDENYFSD
jgi:hypothetical protein